MSATVPFVFNCVLFIGTFWGLGPGFFRIEGLEPGPFHSCICIKGTSCYLEDEIQTTAFFVIHTVSSLLKYFVTKQSFCSLRFSIECSGRGWGRELVWLWREMKYRVSSGLNSLNCCPQSNNNTADATSSK